jgi:hypothetical protein
MSADWGRLLLALAVSAAAGIVAAWVVRKLLRRRRRRPSAPQLSLSFCPTEQRSSKRRTELEVPVQVSDADGQAPSRQAVMVNCSQGGLRLVGDEAYPVGTVLSIRGMSKKAVWLRVRVRNCLSSGPRWEVGCQFVRRPSRRQLRQLS